MSVMTIAGLMVAVLMAAIVLRMPIAVAMGIVGAVGYSAIAGPDALLAYLNTAMVDKFVSYDLSVVPLFILMGHIATSTGMSQSIFRASNAVIGHVRGGLAMATVGGCAVFGSICGSSIATASTMAQVALPEMKRFGYSGRLSAGALAAGGTLGILIPPSVVLIIFALLTEQNIAKLFLAATLPGTIAVLGFVAAIFLYVRIFPGEGAAHAGITMKDRLRALAGVWHVVALFAIVLGGIYGGVFTPAEGAAVGVVIAMAIGVVTRRLTPRAMLDSMVRTGATSAMIFAILFGADLFNVALALTRLPNLAVDWMNGLGLAPMAVLAVLIVFYLVMGCVMDSLSIILLTIPVFFPAFMSLDFGLAAEQQALWFGIMTLIVVELGMITPPVGLNLFVISSMAPEIPTRHVFAGVLPFIAAELVRTALIVAFPALTYWLVELVF